MGFPCLHAFFPVFFPIAFRSLYLVFWLYHHWLFILQKWVHFVTYFLLNRHNCFSLCIIVCQFVIIFGLFCFLFFLYKSVFNQRNRTTRRYIPRDLLQVIGLHNGGDKSDKLSPWGGLSGQAAGTAGGHWSLGVCPESELLLGRLSSALKSFQLIESGPPILSR